MSWIVNQVRLKAQLYDIRPAYIHVGGQLPNKNKGRQQERIKYILGYTLYYQGAKRGR